MSKVAATRVAITRPAGELHLTTTGGAHSQRGSSTPRCGIVDEVLHVPSATPLTIVVGSGSVTGNMPGSRFHISAVDGSFRVSLRATTERYAVALSVRAGSITVALPGAVNARLAAQATIGRVRTGLPVRPTELCNITVAN